METYQPDSADSIRIGVDVDQDQYQQLLTELCYDTSIIDLDGAISPDIDLCVVSETGLQKNPDELTKWRDQRLPIFSPIVILSETSPENIYEEHDTLSIGFDIVIETPISKEELTNRINSLLQRQRLSLESCHKQLFVESLFDSSSSAKLVITADRTIVRANKQIGELFDVESTKLVGQSYNQNGKIRIGENEERTVVDGPCIEEVFKTGDPISNHECIIQHSNHEDVIVSVDVVPLSWGSDSVEFVLVSIQNITEQKEREGKLQQMKNAADNAPIGITLTDPSQEDNPVIYVNDEFVEQTGYPRKEVIGRNLRFLQGEQTDNTTVEELRRAIDAPEPVSVTIRNYRADGTEYWNRLEIAPITDQNGNVINYVGFQQDVTEQKERERELSETKEQLDLVLSETNTGVWTFNPKQDSIIPINMPKSVELKEKETDIDSYLKQIHPDDRESVRKGIMSAIDSQGEFDIEFRLNDNNYERWLRSYGTVTIDDGNECQVVGITTEITERVNREKALKKRERMLRELHTATRQFYPPESMKELAEFVVNFLESSLGLKYVSIKLFDEKKGNLRTTVSTTMYKELSDTFDTVTPGHHPIWEAYQTGELRIVGLKKLEELIETPTITPSQLLAVPIGDFGVLVAYLTDESKFVNVDIDLIEVLTANAEAVFQGLKSAEAEAELMEELSIQQTQVEQLRNIVNTTQALQERASQAKTRPQLDDTICEELTNLDTIDFVWIGRPQTTDTTLTVTATAGGGEKYLDTVRSSPSQVSLPANIAANESKPYTNEKISQDVRNTEWAKEALSFGYNSVVSVPLIHDKVLYGVVTAYSSQESAFTDIYQDLIADTGSLLLNYTHILDQQPLGSNQPPTTVTFEFDDDSYALQRLAAVSDSEIKVKTVARVTNEAVTVVAEVTKGDRQEVCDYADELTAVKSVTSFGTDESMQVLINCPKQFFATAIEKHGGRLVTSTANPDGSRIQIQIPSSVSRRPLFEFISSHFEDAELIAQEKTASPEVSKNGSINSLTDRQREILNAAYYGGYYETPREITGEELAESFGISSPAVYNHLQAAHKKIVRNTLEGDLRLRARTLDN